MEKIIESKDAGQAATDALLALTEERLVVLQEIDNARRAYDLERGALDVVPIEVVDR